MDISFDDDMGSGPALSAAATHARELSQKIIVAAFRDYVRGRGPGPKDSDLKVFAKLAVVEHALSSRSLPLPPLSTNAGLTRGSATL